MNRTIRMKTTLNFIILFTFLVFGFMFVGCSRDALDGTDKSATSQTTEASQSDLLSSTPVPTSPEKRVFEQIDDKSLLTIEEGKDNLFVVGNDQAFEIQGELFSKDYTTDSSKVAMLIDISEEGTGKLELFDGTDVLEVALDVSAFRISNDGSTLAFLTGAYSEGIGCDLYMYDCESRETQLISQSAGWLFMLSPNGKAIAYTVFDDPENLESWSCVLWVENGYQAEYARDMVPVALTDNGTIIYAINISAENGTINGNKDELWAFTGNNQLLLGSVSEESQNAMAIIFNKDLTQVLFDGAKGIYFSKNAEEPVLVEMNAHIGLVSPSCKSIWLQNSADEYYSFYLDFTCTQNLYHTLMIISSPKNDKNNIWYFTEEMKAVLLTSISKYESYKQTEDSILTYNDQTAELIYVEDIYSEKYLSGYDTNMEFRIDCQGIWQYLLTKDNTIYYCNSEAESAFDVHPFDLHRITFDAQDDAILSTNCTWITKYERDNEPDIIYYLEYDETESLNGESGYIYTYYFDLYMVEDIDGAVPQKIAENVSNVYAGEYGVIYLQLDHVSPNLVRFFAGDPEFSGDGNKIFDVDIYDENKIFYSDDGIAFRYVSNVAKRYMYGG